MLLKKLITFEDIRNESIFANIFGLAKCVLENTEREQNPEIYDMATCVYKYSRIRLISYKKKDSKLLINFLQKVIEPELFKGHRPIVMFVISLQYLLLEVEHYEAVNKFKKFISLIRCFDTSLILQYPEDYNHNHKLFTNILNKKESECQ